MSRLYIILFDLTFLKVITHIAKLSPPCCVECSLNLVGRTWAERILESNQNIASTMNALNNVKVIHLSASSRRETTTGERDFNKRFRTECPLIKLCLCLSNSLH